MNHKKTKPYVDNFLLEKTIRDDAFLSRDERFLLLILATYRHAKTLSCNPPILWLASRFGKSIRTIRRVVVGLERRDYLVSIRVGFNKPNCYYFATDFKAALVAYHCPHFKGDKGLLLKANRKRWVVKSTLNDGFVHSGSDTIDGRSLYKREVRKGIDYYGEDYVCPHCHPQQPEGNSHEEENE